MKKKFAERGTVLFGNNKSFEVNEYEVFDIDLDKVVIRSTSSDGKGLFKRDC